MTNKIQLIDYKKNYKWIVFRYTSFHSNSKPEEKLSPQFTAVNEGFDFFFDNTKVAFEKVLCKGLKTKANSFHMLEAIAYNLKRSPGWVWKLAK